MATKMERIDREIQKTREKIAEYQENSRLWKHRKPRRRIWRLFRWFAPCG